VNRQKIATLDPACNRDATSLTSVEGWYHLAIRFDSPPRFFNRSRSMSQSPVIDPTQSQPSFQQERKKSNSGCIVAGVVGGCLIAVMVCGGVIATGVVGAFALIKSSEPYTESLARAQTNEELQSMIGDPVDASIFVQGSIKLNNDDGNTDLNYSVSGPNGAATVHVTGTKLDGNWDYSRMDATTEDGTKIDLLDEPTSENGSEGDQ